MRPSFFSKKWGWVLVLAMVLSLNSVMPVGRAAEALPPATIVSVQVDPGKPTFWTVWYDQTAVFNNVAYLSHHEGDGNTLQVFSVPRAGALLPQAGFVWLPNSTTRFYYPDYQPSEQFRIALKGVAYLDTFTGDTKWLASNFDLSVCQSLSQAQPSAYPQRSLVYNPQLGHLYMPCNAGLANGQDALVIDTASDRIIGLLPYLPLAYNPVNQRLYAQKFYPTDPPYPVTSLFDLMTLDARTEKPTADPPMIEKYSAGGISSILVNPQSGDVYLTRTTCLYKCAPNQQAAFDKTGQRTQDWSDTPVDSYLLLNDARNQLYGRHWNGTYIAVDAGNLRGGQLAAFGWTPLAAVPLYDRVIGVDNRDAYSPLLPNHGLGLVFMSGTNFDVAEYHPVRPPDGFFSQYSVHLPEPPRNLQGIFFKETGHILSGKFLEYWQSHGGLAIFGFPMTEVFLDYNSADGKLYQVQYFERNRFELHPENAGTPYEVQLGLLGKYFSAVTGPEITAHYSSGETTPIPGGVLFKETGHTLTGKFFEYWQNHGGLALFGLPLTEPFRERNTADGQTYLVQYFERNRFELHPELAGTPYEVELGLLGNQLLHLLGWPQ
jgi:hypothetical protein